MKILIAYYSRTGGTEKLAEVLEENFKKQGHSVDVEKIRPVKEHGFWVWFLIRMFKGECPIEEPKTKDVFGYDCICIGSPNWTRLSLPVAKYLKEIEGLKYKKVGFFSTTFLWPPIEWYIFSAYFLDLTFSAIAGEKGGRIIDDVLLSSALKKWSVDSDYGRKKIKDFCEKLTTPTLSLKDYILEQKEISETRLLIILFSTFLFFATIFQIVSSAFGRQVFSWGEYLVLLSIGFFAYFPMLVLRERRVGLFLGKYLAGGALSLGWTLTALFLAPSLGRPIILVYALLFMLVGFFREIKAVLLTGLIAILGYVFLFFSYPHKEILVPTLDLSLLFASLVVVSFITKNLQNHYLSLLDTQDEIEKARASLEGEVGKRTKELRDLAGSLDEQVRERTKELQGKVEELERFHKLAVGRELRMVGLKEEIEEFKKQLEKSKPST